jgi:hypothetical protein
MSRFFAGGMWICCITLTVPSSWVLVSQMRSGRLSCMIGVSGPTSFGVNNNSVI